LPVEESAHARRAECNKVFDLFILRCMGAQRADPAPDRGAVVAELLRCHHAALYRYAFLLCDSAPEAEDLVQEAFARLVTGQADLERIQHPAPYLRRSITNLFLERARRHTWWIGHMASLVGRASVDDVAEGAASRDQVRQGLSRLTDRQRAAIVLRYYLDLDYDEIGHVLGCPSATARSLTMRGLHRMRVTLTAAEEGADSDH
jgi:RNA polymerase sigma factor (sigma-70 family)